MYTLRTLRDFLRAFGRSLHQLRLTLAAPFGVTTSNPMAFVGRVPAVHASRARAAHPSAIGCAVQGDTVTGLSAKLEPLYPMFRRLCQP